MNEEWKAIPDWEGIYEASNLGRIRSIDHKVLFENQFGPCSKNIKGRLLKFKIDKYGYPCLSLARKGKHTCYTVHHLVVITFIGKYDGKKYNVNHIDGNKINNNICNLEIVTIQRNIQHSYENNLNLAYGENHTLSKLKNDEILLIRELYKTGNYSRPELAKMFGVSTPSIMRIVLSKSRFCKNQNLPPIKMIRWKKNKSAFNRKQVEAIRKIYSETGCSFAELGLRYSVSPCTIARVIKNKDYGINIVDLS